MSSTPKNTALRILSRTCIALIACASIVPALAQSESGPGDLERRVKAAFLYKFAGYVEWPQSSFAKPAAPLTIAVTGDDPLADDLGRLVVGHTVHGRIIAVRKFKIGQSLEDVNVLFIGSAARSRLEEIIRTTRPQPILIVTDSEGALDHGSMINFAIVDGRVRFEISTVGAEVRGLKMSSRLLAVAWSVRTGTP